jgi:predicted MPP superfamily phosphohydrolase
MVPLIDPRWGDVEDDASSTKSRSLLSLAGSLLAEISFPKLILVWLLLVALPSLILGLAPLVLSAWLTALSHTLLVAYTGIGAFALLAAVAAAGWFGGRPLLRFVEQVFWSLNSIAVQPVYMLFRELLRHLIEAVAGRSLTAQRRASLRAGSAAVAGIVLCAIAAGIVALLWPLTRWTATPPELLSPVSLMLPALANAATLLSAYVAVATLVWSIADATMDQPLDRTDFATPAGTARTWRVAHLSDIHIVGERYGFRIESGRAGPSGNGRLAALLRRLDTIHAEAPLDLVLITGDITDAGRSAEWAEFFDLVLRHPALRDRILILPGNHDINVVDRANPARLDLPLSPGRRLREMRALSGIAAVQGQRVRVVDLAKGRLGAPLDEFLAGHAADIAAFADRGTLRLSARLERVWAESFPMVLPPADDEGLGVIVLNSTAQTHFSFTNALGLVPAEQAAALHAVAKQYPRARWIVALHHHLVEYPTRAKALSERVGTALINGSWFVRQLRRFGRRIVVMHGHRHVDWIGRCGDLQIVSAPSPVMEARDSEPTSFLIHTLAAGPDGALDLLPPRRIAIEGGEPLREYS